MRMILTIGHSTHQAEGFVRLLRDAGVGEVADVRRHPGSRRMPWWNAAELERTLAAAGIGYVHLPELGGRRDPDPDSPNTGWRVGQFRGYADHMASEEFAAGVKRLLALAGERRTAAMCAEAQWWRCHRRLLADALVVAGHQVVHLDARGGSAPHELTTFALVEGARITYPPEQPSLEV